MKFLKKIEESSRLKVIIVVIVLMLIVAPFLSNDFDQVKEFIATHTYLGIIASQILYMVFGLAFIPTEPLTIFLATLMSPLIVIIVCTIGNTFACLIEYYIGLGVSDLSNFEKQKSKLPFNLGSLPVDSYFFQFFGRAIPGFGPKLVSVMSGIYRYQLFNFLWISIVTNLIGAIILTFGGNALARIF